MLTIFSNFIRIIKKVLRIRKNVNADLDRGFLLIRIQIPDLRFWIQVELCMAVQIKIVI